VEKYIQSFIKVCESVFRDFCSTEVKAGEVFYLTRENRDMGWDISGIIGLSGQISGAVALSMKDNVAFQVTKTLTGVDHNAFDADVIDAIGEIINIITGNIKKEFEASYRTAISIPSIVQGKGHKLIWPSKNIRIICIPFIISSGEELFISIAVDEAK
jgi:chemotaxis protein CheX